MEALGGFLIACAAMLVVMAVVLRVIAACHRFLCFLRGEPTSRPVQVRSQHAPRPGVTAYRSRNGRSIYEFQIVPGGGGYRVYITGHPSYGNRDTSAHATHRLSDSHGHYICWNRTLTSVEDARKVAAAWADKTEDYILYGTRF